LARPLFVFGCFGFAPCRGEELIAPSRYRDGKRVEQTDNG